MNASVVTELRCTFTPEARLRRAAFGERMMTDPMILNFMLASVAGPEIAPAECYTDANVDHILSLA